MTTLRSLIVNADDFGMSPGVNAGIIRAHEEGIVTSASLMVRWPAAGPAADYARAHPALSVGLHADLGEMTYRDGQWVDLYRVVDPRDAAAVSAEILRQLSEFRRLVGREPTHLDSHQHVHHDEPARSILMREAERRGIPLRDCSPRVRYCGAFYGQSNKGYPYPEGVSVEALIRILASLPPGATEMGCHPAAAADVESMYCRERIAEVQTLCDPRVRKAIETERIELRSFAALM
jgi:predicted glycoside hydrolase/deacetylase ChbG (UPF0249 family)